MKKKGTILKFVNIGRISSILLMIFCLTLLTSANFFIYSVDDVVQTEEKSTSSSSSLSINEEILHEAHPEFNFKAIDLRYLHHIAEAEKIEMFHPERILPPPKFS